jgi:hypothetical protein
LIHEAVGGGRTRYDRTAILQALKLFSTAALTSSRAVERTERRIPMMPYYPARDGTMASPLTVEPIHFTIRTSGGVLRLLYAAVTIPRQSRGL